MVQINICLIEIQNSPRVGGFDRALDFRRGSLSLNSPFTVRAAIHAF